MMVSKIRAIVQPDRLQAIEQRPLEIDVKS